jgi:nitrogenase subunit NifH
MRSEANWSATPDPLTVVESTCPQRGHGDCAGESDMALMTVSLLGARAACRRRRLLQLADVVADLLAGGFDLS